MRDFRGQEVNVGDFLITHNGGLWQSVQADASIWTRGGAIAVVSFPSRKLERKYIAHNMLVKLPVGNSARGIMSLRDVQAMDKRERSKLWGELAASATKAHRAELRTRRGFSR